MKSIDDALELRGRIFGSFELAELASTQAEIDRLMTFVVVGAGPTGVEMAGQISELARRTLKRDFRRIDPTKARVILLDAAPAVLGSFGEKLGDRAVKRLTEMGVEVRLGAKVVDVDSTGIEVEHADGSRERIESVCKVWAAGVSASPLGRQLADQSGAELDRAGRIEVQDDLTLPGHPEVFVVGDMMALEGLPGVAQVAIQGGRYAAEQIVRRLEGQEPKGPFEYFDKGSMATISRFSAVASVGKAQFSGFFAWILWLAVHLVYIIGFKHRITTLLHWVVTFIGRGRSERVVTEQQVFARQAIADLGAGLQPRAAPPREGPPHRPGTHEVGRRSRRRCLQVDDPHRSATGPAPRGEPARRHTCVGGCTARRAGIGVRGRGAPRPRRAGGARRRRAPWPCRAASRRPWRRRRARCGGLGVGDREQRVGGGSGWPARWAPKGCRPWWPRTGRGRVANWGSRRSVALVTKLPPSFFAAA